MHNAHIQKIMQHLHQSQKYNERDPPDGPLFNIKWKSKGNHVTLPIPPPSRKWGFKQIIVIVVIVKP